MSNDLRFPCPLSRGGGLTAATAATRVGIVAERRYDLEDRLIRFGAEVCRLAEQLPSTTVGAHVGRQLIRSGTSPLANYGEVQGAESRRDFIHKLGICLKELRETSAWLQLIQCMQLCPIELCGPTLRECGELVAILASSVRTAKRGDRGRARM